MLHIEHDSGHGTLFVADADSFIELSGGKKEREGAFFQGDSYDKLCEEIEEMFGKTDLSEEEFNAGVITLIERDYRGVLDCFPNQSLPTERSPETKLPIKPSGSLPPIPSLEMSKTPIQTLDISGEICPVGFESEIFHKFGLNEDRTGLFYDDVDSVIKSYVVASTKTNGGIFIATATSNGFSPSHSKLATEDDHDCYSEINLKLQGAAQDHLIDAILTNIPQKARDFGEKYDWDDKEIETLIQSTELFRDPNDSQRIDSAVHFNPENSNVVEMERLKFISFEKSSDKVFFSMEMLDDKIKESLSLPEGQQKAFNRKLNEKIRAATEIPEKKQEKEPEKYRAKETNLYEGR